MFFLIFFSLSSKDIERMSFLTINGVIELRDEIGTDESIRYRTLNHEGGLKVRVLDVVKSVSCENETYIWLYVVLTEPFWADTGEFVEAKNKFWILIDDEKKFSFN